jgi:hypothetical protein
VFPLRRRSRFFNSENLGLTLDACLIISPVFTVRKERTDYRAKRGTNCILEIFRAKVIICIQTIAYTVVILILAQYDMGKIYMKMR